MPAFLEETRMNQMNEQFSLKKLPYRKPVLTEYGDVRTLTLAVTPNAIFDTQFQRGSSSDETRGGREERSRD